MGAETCEQAILLVLLNTPGLLIEWKSHQTEYDSVDEDTNFYNLNVCQVISPGVQLKRQQSVQQWSWIYWESIVASNMEPS